MERAFIGALGGAEYYLAIKRGGAYKTDPDDAPVLDAGRLTTRNGGAN
jgi:hypothetical protein